MPRTITCGGESIGTSACRVALGIDRSVPVFLLGFAPRRGFSDEAYQPPSSGEAASSSHLREHRPSTSSPDSNKLHTMKRHSQIGSCILVLVLAVQCGHESTCLASGGTGGGGVDGWTTRSLGDAAWQGHTLTVTSGSRVLFLHGRDVTIQEDGGSLRRHAAPGRAVGTARGRQADQSVGQVLRRLPRGAGRLLGLRRPPSRLLRQRGGSLGSAGVDRR